MQPSVSIIVPCLNEQATIGGLLSAILEQTYPKDRLEVVVADGHSVDGTRDAISRFQAEHPELRIAVLNNDQRTIPSGLNRAMGASSGEIIVRLDAHSIPIREYVARCVEALESGRGENVGGVWRIVPGSTGAVARAIAAAAAHPLGAGDARYRLGGSARAVDTVPFGAFRRGLLANVGGFDETLLTNEDYEFNFRIRQSGGTVWLDPSISSEYIARATLSELGRQYWRYGFWKFRMLVRYPRSIRWRQALPPLFVLAVVGLLILAPSWGPAGVGALAVIGGYALVLLVAAAAIAVRRRDASLVPASVAAFATMHFGWGGGFLWSLLSGAVRRNG
jgi:succinoglycan biosynthesis protein ExoA